MRSLRASRFKGVELALPRQSRPVRARRPLCVENRTLWSLQVDQAWCDVNKEQCEKLEPSIDLTDVISEKLKCIVGETKNSDFVRAQTPPNNILGRPFHYTAPLF